MDTKTKVETQLCGCGKGSGKGRTAYDKCADCHWAESACAGAGCGNKENSSWHCGGRGAAFSYVWFLVFFLFRNAYRDSVCDCFHLLRSGRYGN